MSATHQESVYGHNQPARRTEPGNRAWYRLMIGFLVLGISSLSCSYAQASNFVETLTYLSATPDLTATGIAQMTATVMLGKVGETLGKKEIVVILDPLGERDISNVQTDAVEFTQSILVESIDPVGRYLPNVGLFTKNREPTQQVILTLVGAKWVWSVHPVETLDVSSLTEKMLGNMSLGSLTQYLASAWDRGAINIIVPVQDSYNDADTFDVYQTPAAHTLLLMKPSATGNTMRLAAPMKLPVSYSYAIFSFLSPPSDPLTNYLSQVQNVQTGNYTGSKVDDINWAETKVKESPDGVPEGYVPSTAGISAEMINWINFDQVFVRSAFFLKSSQVEEPCVKAEDQKKIIRQEPAAGSTINALKQTVKLVVCAEVVSQKKYQTLMYVSPTASPTSTTPPTRTTVPTVTNTPTVTTAPTNTPKPTNTPQPTNTSAPSATTASTSTTGPTSTTAPSNTPSLTSTLTPSPTPSASATRTVSATPSPTTTPVAQIKDDFVTDPSIYDPAVWNVIDVGGGGVRSWAREERMRQEIISVVDDMKLQSKKACLWGRTEIKIRTLETGDGEFQYGWMDTTDYKTTTNGIYVRSDATDIDNTKIVFAVREGGIETSAETITLSADTYGVYHTFRIIWDVLDETHIEASIYIDGSATPAKTISNIERPENKLNFVLGNSVGTVGAANTSIIEVEYVYVYSDNCE